MKRTLLILLLTPLLISCSFPWSNNQSPISTPTPPEDLPVGVFSDDEIQENATQGQYLEYSQTNLTQALTRGRTIIFFHANWCPYCKAADAELKANPDQIPSDVTILKADYDTEKQLKQRYNITTQDTFVLIDVDGNEVLKWTSGGQALQTIESNLTTS